MLNGLSIAVFTPVQGELFVRKEGPEKTKRIRRQKILQNDIRVQHERIYMHMHMFRWESTRMPIGRAMSAPI